MFSVDESTENNTGISTDLSTKSGMSPCEETEVRVGAGMTVIEDISFII